MASRGGNDPSGMSQLERKQARQKQLEMLEAMASGTDFETGSLSSQPSIGHARHQKGITISISIPTEVDI